MKRAVIFGFAVLGLASGGCFIPYMMIRGTTEPLQLASNPPGAMASVASGSSCQTPCTLEMPRNSSIVVTFTKAGCKQNMVSIFPTISGGGMLWGGVFGEMSGADYDLQPNPAVVNLDCVELAPVASIAPSVAVTSDHARDSSPSPTAHDDNWRKVGP